MFSVGPAEESNLMPETNNLFSIVGKLGNFHRHKLSVLFNLFQSNKLNFRLSNSDFSN